MNKKILTSPGYLATAGILCMAAIAQSPAARAGDYLFVGVHRPPLANNKACPRFALVTEEFQTEDEAKAFKKSFLANKEFMDKSTEIFKPGRTGLVYQYQGHSPGLHGKCVFTKYSTAIGRDEPSARDNLAAHVRTFREYFISEPEVIKVWDRSGLDRITRHYDGVEVTYLVRKTPSASTVVAQIRNTNPDKLARLFFRVNGKLLKKPVDVDPQGKANFNLGRDVEHFGAAVQWLDPQERNQSISDEMMNSLKNSVREQIMIKDGKPQGKGSAIGVRG
ncbi:hypothetical protein [Paucimonas lemoignei]|nr:hypothetical protein [Paucimonas lemoignei]